MVDERRAHEVLAKAEYVLVTTFRKDGRAVPTPIWAAPDGDRLVAVTGAESGKIKRIRRDGRVLLAPCDARGRPRGMSIEGRAAVLPDSDVAVVETRVSSKYGWKYGGIQLVERVGRLGRRGGEPKRAAIELRVVPDLS